MAGRERSGRFTGCSPNRVYLSETVQERTASPGEHPALVDRGTGGADRRARAVLEAVPVSLKEMMMVARRADAEWEDTCGQAEGR